MSFAEVFPSDLMSGVPKKRVAQPLGFDVTTVQRYLAAARGRGVEPANGLTALDDGLVER